MKTNTFPVLTEHQLCTEMKETFSRAPVSTRSAVKAINNLLFMLSTQKISEAAMSNIYISLLKGFQSKDSYLKACIYNAIIGMAKYTDEAFVGVNILVNDLNSDMPEEMKALALRALFAIVPSDMVYDFGKYVTQAAVSGSVARRDAAVLISYRLLVSNFLQVRRWLEGVDLVNDPLADYHIVGFLAQAKKMPLGKLEGLSGAAGMLAVRMCAEALKEGKEALPVLKKFLNTKYNDEVVFLEAARAIGTMSEEYALQLLPQTVQSLRIFLRSSNVALQFSAMRAISQLAMRYPQKVAMANKEIEDLVSSENRAVSMFAITALLKTGTEETVDRLVRHIPGIIHEMSDSFKRVAIDTLESLSESFESKKANFIEFLGRALTEKSGLEFKKYIVGVIGRISRRPDDREKVLDMLCSYMEDSQYYQISLDILGILGREIPESRTPNRYVMHVLNRLVLENNHVRAAALQCLYDVRMAMPSPTAEAAIRSCLGDRDEMVREMARFLSEGIEAQKTMAGEVSREFTLDELGSLKMHVMKYMHEPEEEREEKRDLLIKECREQLLTDAAADVYVKVIKRVFEDKLIFRFVLENKLDGVQISGGVLSLVSSRGDKKERSIEVDAVNPGEAFVVEKEWNVEKGSVVNGLLDYTVCLEGDASDTETESITLEPFRVSLLDYVRPVGVAEMPIKKRQVSFALQGDIYMAGKKILDLLNMKIVSQDSASDTMLMALSGVYGDVPIVIHVDLLYSSYCRCIVDVYCDDEAVAQQVVELFD
jgi:coatomer subunit gamma